VNIQADQAPDGYTFGQWFIESGNPVIADMHASNTTLTMGNDDLSHQFKKYLRKDLYS